MTEDLNRNKEAEKQNLLDQGYNALASGSFQEAGELFADILKENPGCGLSCLGLYLAENQLTGRSALAEQWKTVQQDPQFISAMEQADPDFLQWLKGDLEASQPEIQNSRKHAFKRTRIFPGAIPQFLELQPSRKTFFIFQGIQLSLFLLESLFFSKSQTDIDGFFTCLLAGLLLSCTFSGIYVLLGILYGRSLVKGRRFSGILKFINNIVCTLGCGVNGIMILAFREAIQGGSTTQRENRFFCYGFAVIFLISLCSLIFPILIRNVKSREK